MNQMTTALIRSVIFAGLLVIPFAGDFAEACSMYVPDPRTEPEEYMAFRQRDLGGLRPDCSTNESRASAYIYYAWFAVPFWVIALFAATALLRAIRKYTFRADRYHSFKEWLFVSRATATDFLWLAFTAYTLPVFDFLMSPVVLVVTLCCLIYPLIRRLVFKKWLPLS